jgi:hypothetical protein
MSGQLDTSGTSAGGHSQLENIAAVFGIARARDLQVALRAMDPADHEVGSEQVQVSQGITVVHGDPEADRKRVAGEAERTRELVGDEEAVPVPTEPSSEAPASEEGSGTPVQESSEPKVEDASTPVAPVESPAEPERPKQPNKAGPGSSRDEWISYAKQVDPELTDERAQSMTRAELITAYGA